MYATAAAARQTRGHAARLRACDRPPLLVTTTRRRLTLRRLASVLPAGFAVWLVVQIVTGVREGTVKIATEGTPWVAVWAESPVGFVLAILLLLVCVAGAVILAIDLFRSKPDV